MDNLSGQIVKGYELRERIGAGALGRCTAPSRPQSDARSR